MNRRFKLRMALLDLTHRPSHRLVAETSINGTRWSRPKHPQYRKQAKAWIELLFTLGMGLALGAVYSWAIINKIG